MKTISHLVRRYIVAAFGIVLVVFLVNVGLVIGVIIHFGTAQQEGGYLPISQLAASFTKQEDGGYVLDTNLDWRACFQWVMELDDQGKILWSEGLPAELNHPYTVPQTASFTRWYLEDYPIMAYRNDYGLLVAGMPVGSMTRFDFYMDNDILHAILSGIVPLLLLDGAMILLACLLLGWRGARPLRKLAEGIDCLAAGEPVCLEERGSTAELAEKLNQAGEYLQQQRTLIAQRDTARTNWIAGVSHDIRTPLALIMGYAEQLVQQAPERSEQRSRASAICRQSQKIKSLIEDLNLTSKLQYDAQPLRMGEVQTGPWLRWCGAEFFDQLEEHCDLELVIAPTAERLRLELDVELMSRAVENLLNNSVRHNPGGCTITVTAEAAGTILTIRISDNGSGYPDGILQLLENPAVQTGPNTPHILGLHLVQQIVMAHGGTVKFFNAHGAAAVLELKGK